jgi:hypothetical protein
LLCFAVGWGDGVGPLGMTMVVAGGGDGGGFSRVDWVLELCCGGGDGGELCLGMKLSSSECQGDCLARMTLTDSVISTSRDESHILQLINYLSPIGEIVVL